MNHTKLTDKRLTEAAKEVLGIHYFKSDEDFLKWAEENYYCEALNWKEFAREFVAIGYWGEVSSKLEVYLDYKAIGAELAQEFYMAKGVVFFRGIA